MSLWNHLRDFFGGAPKLRNKAGGMAWIKLHGTEFGAGVLAGLPVKTVRLVDRSFWEVKPMPSYVLTANVLWEGMFVPAGTTVYVRALADEVLEPWRDIGDDEQSEESAFQPPVPAVREPRKVEA